MHLDQGYLDNSSQAIANPLELLIQPIKGKKQQKYATIFGKSYSQVARGPIQRIKLTGRGRAHTCVQQGRSKQEKCRTSEMGVMERETAEDLDRRG